MRSSKQRSRSKPNRPRTMGNIVNRVFDSSGPEGKVRGTPQQIIEKYQLLARDAQLSNDRVAYENFLQHSEHYTRMLGEANREMQREAEERRESQGNGNANGQHRPFNGDQGQQGAMEDEAEGDFAEQPRQQPRDYQARDGQNRDGQNRDGQNRDQQPREPREYQPRDQQPRDQQPRDQQNRDPRDSQPRDQRNGQLRDAQAGEQPRDQQPRESRREQPRRDSQPRDSQPRESQAQRPAPARSVIAPMMPDLSALGSPIELDSDTDSGLVETPEMKPQEQAAPKAPRRRSAPRKPKAEATVGAETAPIPDEAAE